MAGILVSIGAACVVCSILTAPGQDPFNSRGPEGVALCSQRMTIEQTAIYAREAFNLQLPYVYFQHGSTKAPARYHRINGPVTLCIDEETNQWLSPFPPQ